MQIDHALSISITNKILEKFFDTHTPTFDDFAGSQGAKKTECRQRCLGHSRVKFSVNLHQKKNASKKVQKGAKILKITKK